MDDGRRAHEAFIRSYVGHNIIVTIWDWGTSGDVVDEGFG